MRFSPQLCALFFILVGFSPSADSAVFSPATALNDVAEIDFQIGPESNHAGQLADVDTSFRAIDAEEAAVLFATSRSDLKAGGDRLDSDDMIHFGQVRSPAQIPADSDATEFGILINPKTSTLWTSGGVFLFVLCIVLRRWRIRRLVIS